MAKSKSLIIGIVGLVLVVVLGLVLILKDNVELVSAKEAEHLLVKQGVSDIIYDTQYIYFTLENKRYKAYGQGLDSKIWALDKPVIVKNQYFFSEILGEFGVVIVLILGLAVLLQALRLLFKKPKVPQQKKAEFLRENESPLETHISQGVQTYTPLDSGVRFKDVAGISEVKEELLEIIDYLKRPKFYQDLGIALPKGVLLVGPPGVGKTMIAKAVAGEASVPFFYQSGSSFVQIYAGMGAKRVRELFMKAKANAPSIVFIDEIDAVGKARGNTRSDEREATLNQLLTEMDGFEDSSGVIVIAATNKIEVLDEALLRSGRFDRRIYVELPNLEERKHILELYLRGKSHNVDIHHIARLCVGFSGAALAALVNESALNALRHKRKEITQEDILATKDKVLVGKKKALSLSEQEKEILAIYQGAKALSAYWLEIDFDKIGLVGESFKQIDKELISKQELMGKIKVALAGNIATKLIYQQSFSNAKDDLARAKEIATQMCVEYGMAERLLGDVSDVAYILDTAQKEMSEFLTNAKPLLEKVAKELLAKERLSKEEIKAIYEASL